MNNIIMPPSVKLILNKLNKNGYEAFIVGGCVRDSIMGIKPKDWDITTNASPVEVKKIFNHTIDTGLKHGTVSVIESQQAFEVTTYRIDGNYLDSRHPEYVIFTSSLEEDLRRRDFTINSMAYNDMQGIVDPYGGMRDIKLNIIRAVGDPIKRFEEDALRILRAIRFSARFNYEIEEKTFMAMSLISKNLRDISNERIRDELLKTINSNHPEKLLLYNEIGLNNVFDSNLYIIKEPDFELIKRDDFIEVKLARILECCKVEYKEFLKIMRIDNKSINSIMAILNTKIRDKLNCIDIKHLLNKYDIHNTRLILNYSPTNIRKYNLNLVNKIIEELQPYSRSHLAIKGTDILNYVEDKNKMKYILEKLVDIVICDPSKNDKEFLINYTKEYLCD